MPRPILAVLLSCAALPAVAETVRFASFNGALSRESAGELAEALATGADPQAQRVAEVIQRVRPDVLLVNEVDLHDDIPGLFARLYLGEGQDATGAGPAEPIAYDYVYTAPVNTGVLSGADLNNDGRVGGPGDAKGFGLFPGQYGMLVLSRFPIDTEAARTFQTLLWRDMPGARLPADPEDVNGDGDTASWYSEEALAVLPLSSKSHWDLPIEIAGETVHFLASHPTPPVFDGPEDRNGLRNADEIRFWADYVGGAGWMQDDAGVTGGLAPGSAFVIVGDLNADPLDGDSAEGAIMQLLGHPAINASPTDPAITPASEGAIAAADLQAGANRDHRGNPAFDTGDFGGHGSRPDRAPGNVRIDYALPSVAGLRYLGGGVFWPAPEDPLAGLTGPETSDHHLVWIDVEVGE